MSSALAFISMATMAPVNKSGKQLKQKNVTEETLETNSFYNIYVFF